MLISAGDKKPSFVLFGFIAFVLSLFAFSSLTQAQTNTTTPTTIAIDDTAKLTTARRLGVNLGNQDFYDSGQFMRNLTFRNPGFEGEVWQTILHCAYVTATSCTDDDLYTYWPANFLKGASVEFLVGPAAGTTSTITSMTAGTIGVSGVTAQFSSLSVAPHVGDYLVARMHVAGNAQAGWWTAGTGSPVFSTEFTDLSPNTPGKQALRITLGAKDQASLSSYMDSSPGKSFLQLHGTYTLTFSAKGTGGANQVNISLGRSVTAPPAVTFFTQAVNLSTEWQDYSYTFQANDTGRIGTLALKFQLAGSSMLIDDVALTAAASSDNPTAYRDEVLNTLQALKPGILRFMDSGTDWGSTIDNMLQPDFARERAGYNNTVSVVNDIPLSLPDFLVLCQTIGAEPWYTMQTGMSTQEMSNLMDYLGGSTSTVYGAKRAAEGHAAPWTSVFKTIHLEFGNEVWNTSNSGATMNVPASYGTRAAAIFTAAKASPSYSANSFDFVLDGWQAIPTWTQSALAAASKYDTVDVAAYVFSNLNDTSSTEAIFGPMFAEPESIVSVPTGLMSQQAAVAAGAAHPAHLAVYETNMGTISGSASEAELNLAIPSVGAGITTTENMLLTMRDLGVTEQNLFAIPGLTAPFTGQDGSTATTSPIWGVVIDMGGLTNLLRPMYLTEQLANSAILPTLLNTSQTGTNPTWNQAYTTNDDFSLAGAHYLQSFAFTDGTKLNVIVFNLSRTSALPINFSGLNTPIGAATISTLTAPVITANNETQSNVAVKTRSQTLAAGTVLSLPPFSMTVVSVAAPVIPIKVTGVTVSCAAASLSPGQSTDCSAAVAGQGKYNSAVTWSVDQGTISSTGVYTAPASVPSSGRANIKATSVGDSTKSVTLALPVAADTITGVSVSCTSTSLGQGAGTLCSATVKGTGGFSSAVKWSASAGSIDASGNLTAPTTGSSVTVTATSTQNTAKFGSATIAVYPVLIMTKASATVTSTTATVSWTLNLAAHSGISYGVTQALGSGTPYDNTVKTNPSYTLTGLKPSTTYYMALYSFINGQTVDQSFSVTTSSSSSSVTSVAVTCAAGSISVGGSTTCSSTVKGTGSYSSAVTWSTSAGSITPAGVLTAPASGTSVTVKVTSVQDPTKSATATVTLTSASTISGLSVTCKATSLVDGKTTTCAAAVSGTGSFSSGVTWTASSGTITSAGGFTAPATGTSVTIKATSTQNNAKSATATITLSPALAITNPSSTVTSTSATIKWSLDLASHSGISYGPTSSLGSSTPYDNNSITAPSYTLTGLKPSTTYYVVLFSFTNSQSVSQSGTITTSAAN